MRDEHQTRPPDTTTPRTRAARLFAACGLRGQAPSRVQAPARTRSPAESRTTRRRPDADQSASGRSPLTRARRTQPPSGTNLGPSATRSTSYVSAWEDLAAVNNGGVPSSSADRANLAYGNWPQQGTQWIEYTWPSARSVNRVSTYWFDDDQGIDLPASCRVQYWNGSAYVAVPGQSACGVAGNTYNSTTFSAVSTTRLRLEITSKTGLSTGVLEWMAFQS
ncbi:MAG: hypothetical protein ABIQ18_16765 [Umezawaea sp.]